MTRYCVRAAPCWSMATLFTWTLHSSMTFLSYILSSPPVSLRPLPVITEALRAIVLRYYARVHVRRNGVFWFRERPRCVLFVVKGKIIKSLQSQKVRYGLVLKVPLNSILSIFPIHLQHVGRRWSPILWPSTLTPVEVMCVLYGVPVYSPSLSWYQLNYTA